MNITQAMEDERRTVEAIRSIDPKRTDRQEIPNPDIIMGRIGVTFLPADRADGYIRLFPQDFLVEEVTNDGQIVHIDSKAEFADSEDRRTLWADMIKIRLSGPYALQELERSLGLEKSQIGAAGIKDALAITAQRLSLRGLDKSKLENLNHPNIILRPVSYGSGALQIGHLKGNRFTIMVRGQVEESRQMIHRSLKHIQEKGFLNFFGPQRFGSRLNVHQLGKKLLQNDMQGLLKAFFCEPGPFDVPLYRELREAMSQSYGDWDRMLQLACHFPFSMKEEMTVINALKQDSRKTRFALSLIKEQVRLWVYAYGSWLINRTISQAVNSGEILPAELPMPFSPQGPLPLYRDLMEQDGTLDFLNVLSQYPYINLSDKTIPAIMMPSGLEAKEVPQGWIVRFELGKGAYATSLLSHLIRMHEGLPIPGWVPLQEVDALKIMGDGSLDNVLEKFKPLMTRRDLEATKVTLNEVAE